MKTIVFTNSFYKNFTGSELAIYDVANYFLKNGYKIYIFCFDTDGPLNEITSKDITVINILKDKIPKINADILWGQHWAVLTKLLASNKIKVKKIIHFSLSPYHFFERMPEYAEKLSKCFGNSWETVQIRKNENHGLDIGIFNNSVTPDFFKMNVKLNSTLKKLAIVGNNGTFGPEGDLAKVLKNNGIDVTFFGFGGNHEIITAEKLTDFDAVFTIGRTVQYCLALGIPVFCYDRFGGPGYINLSNWKINEKMNYSGRTKVCGNGDFQSQLVKKHDIDKIVNDLISNYSKSLKDLSGLQEMSKERYDLFKNIEGILIGLNDSTLNKEDIFSEVDNADILIKEFFSGNPVRKSFLFKLKRESKIVFKKIFLLFKFIKYKI